MARSMAPTLLGSLVLKRTFFQVAPPSVRAIDAAIGVGSVDVAERRDIDAIGIRRVDHHASDLARGFEADVGPGLAGVGGFVHADAVGVLAADIGLAGADVDDIGIRRRHRDGADRADGNALVGDGEPGAAGVLGLPHAAADGAEIEGVGLVGVAGDAIRASAAHGADVAPAQTGQQAAGILAPGAHLLGEDGETQQGRETQEVRKTSQRRRPTMGVAPVRSGLATGQAERNTLPLKKGKSVVQGVRSSNGNRQWTMSMISSVSMGLTM